MQEDKQVSQNQSIRVIIRKKALKIPIFLHNPRKANRNETDTFRDVLKSQQPSKGKVIDIRSKNAVPKLHILNVSTYNFSQTPTPSKDLKTSYFSQTYDTPGTAKHTSHTLSADYRDQVRTAYSNTKKTLNSGPCSKVGSLVKVFKEKITMKDLNLNLPEIIKSKKMKKRIRYKPNFVESLF
jgi:hypothetical protein